MKDIFSLGKTVSGMKLSRGAYLVMMSVSVWALIGTGSSAGAVGANSNAGRSGFTTQTAPNPPTCPGGQCFQDVPSTNPFYSYINHLYLDSIISGYTCGAPPAGLCVPPDNRPYYVTGGNVSRQQMAKFVDNGRRNIADAVGTSLGITSTAYSAIQGTTTSGGNGVVGECLTPNTDCYAISGGAPTGDYAGFFAGGRGVYAGSGDSNRPALDTAASGSTSYGVNAYSQIYRGLGTGRNNTAFFSLYVDKTTGEPANNTIAQVAASMEVIGNLTVDGSKGGYVVDAMQNVDSTTLEPGDVVVIVGSSAPVLGQIPVITVRKALTAYDTQLAGVVDQALYVPDAATRAAYAKQQEAQRVAQAARAQEEQTAAAEGRKPDLSAISMPEVNTTDAQGTVHATDAAQVLPGGYANVVTLGAYKMIKVDASFGPIHAGDLLTTSEHAGYAMKVTDKVAAIGAIVGKALGDLDSGTGVIPVMVTLK